MQHVQVLRDKLTKIRLRNTNYSLRAFARDLNISAGDLCRVIAGKKAMTERFLINLIESKVFEPDEAKMLIECWVEYRKSRLMNDLLNTAHQAVRPPRAKHRLADTKERTEPYQE
jgi:hypothetical protein